MKEKYRYKSLEDTLLQLKNQVIDSIPYCKNLVKGIDNESQLFDYLKMLITYKRDPKNIELLQSAQTLLSNNNWHGKPGYGDCDCFVILSLACLYCMGYKDLYVIIAGNTTYNPSHVYTGIGQYGNTYTPFDLTENFINDERKYKFKQVLPFVI